MAKAIEMGGKIELGQLRVGPLDIALPRPQKLRLHFDFLPDITIDLTRKHRGLLRALKPRATVLVDGSALTINPYAVRKIQPADPRIFDKPTTLDTIIESGVLPVVLAIGVGYLIYRLLR